MHTTRIVDHVSPPFRSISSPNVFSYKANTTAAAATTALTDPMTWFPAPVKWVGCGEPVFTVGFVPLVPILLTMRDGQGVPSDAGGVERVMVLSGATDGHDVPQGARTVDTTD